jgi:hypothetical protein
MNTVLINKAVCIILMQRLGRFAPISKKTLELKNWKKKSNENSSNLILSPNTILGMFDPGLDITLKNNITSMEIWCLPLDIFYAKLLLLGSGQENCVNLNQRRI